MSCRHALYLVTHALTDPDSAHMTDLIMCTSWLCSRLGGRLLISEDFARRPGGYPLEQRQCLSHSSLMVPMHHAGHRTGRKEGRVEAPGADSGRAAGAPPGHV